MGNGRWSSIEIPGRDSLGKNKSSRDVKTKTSLTNHELPNISYQSPSSKAIQSTRKTKQSYNQPNSRIYSQTSNQQLKPNFRLAGFLAVCVLLSVIVISGSFALIKFFTSPWGGIVAVFITIIMFLVIMKKGKFPI
jgi:hypothetical protein